MKKCNKNAIKNPTIEGFSLNSVEHIWYYLNKSPKPYNLKFTIFLRFVFIALLDSLNHLNLFKVII